MAEPTADSAAEHPGAADLVHFRGPADPFAHQGPWTEAAYLALPPTGRSDGRVEVIDGTLLVGPAAGARRRHAVDAVRAAAAAALPDGLRVTGPVPVRLDQDCLLVPDLVVVATDDAQRVADGTAGADGALPPVLDADAVLMVIEVIDGEHGAVDRVFKPQLWARSRVPYALLLDHEAPFAVADMLIGGRYHEYARAEGPAVLVLDEPFRLRLRPDLVEVVEDVPVVEDAEVVEDAGVTEDAAVAGEVEQGGEIDGAGPTGEDDAATTGAGGGPRIGAPADDHDGRTADGAPVEPPADRAGWSVPQARSSEADSDGGRPVAPSPPVAHSS